MKVLRPNKFSLPSGKGFFMHFSTASAKPGDRAVLESRWLYPKPGAQCLQFFLHNTGAADDVLNIWVREDDRSRKLKLFKSISGNKLNITYCMIHSIVFLIKAPMWMFLTLVTPSNI